MELAQARRESIKAFNHEAILAAARKVFASKGLDGASVRAIAKACGYTPGALYSYFPDKEHIYAEILEHELRALADHMRGEIASVGAAATAVDRLRAAVLSFYGYYRANPHAMELGYYLFHGVRPRGLTPELDRRLNGLLISALDMIAAALRDACGGDETGVRRDTVATLAQISGVLLLENTGRLKILGQTGEALMAAWLYRLQYR